MTSVQVVWIAIGIVAFVIAATTGAIYGTRKWLEDRRAERLRLEAHRAELERWYEDTYEGER